MQNKSDYYNEKAITYEKYNIEAAIRYKRALKLAEIYNGADILDIGCKDAYLRRLLKERQITKYYGMDISEAVLNKIEGYDPKYFKVGDVSKKIPFKDNSFDFIFALEIVEHVESPTEMLKEIRRVLKKEGELIISVPNPYCYSEIVANLLGRADTEGHISSFTHQTLKRLLDFAGMKVINTCGTYVRIPFSKRISSKNRYAILKANNIFLTRSYIYKTVIK